MFEAPLHQSHIRHSPIAGRHCPLLLSTMLAAYSASQQFLIEQRTTLGENHSLVGTAQPSEVSRLTRIFRSTIPERSHITALLQCVRSDASNAFTEEQTFRLSKPHPFGDQRLSMVMGVLF